MSRSGYSEGDCYDIADFLRMCGWNANVKRCLAGRAGQAFLWEFYQALEALPARALIQGALRDLGGDYCALGAVARFRGIEIPEALCETAEGFPDEDEFLESMGGMFGIKDMLAREIMYYNDDKDRPHYVPGPTERLGGYITREETPEERWYRMRRWVVKHLKGIP